MPSSSSSNLPAQTSPATYRRVQQIFYDLVKDGKDSIDYASLLARVRPVNLRSTAYAGSRFREDVRRCVMHIHQNGLIALNVGVTPPVAILTRSGKNHFKTLDQRPRAQRAPPVPRPSRKAQAIAEYQQWAAPLITIQQILTARALNPDETFPVNVISATVRLSGAFTIRTSS
ncbi:hypothetical protein L227DRAFT_610511 [Lentinus tigrinus ALCF2SS1-6]|uniref:Uncharacterized protein n=1 Tax=Lentinus tigrinus ALCF2SS1-6 TaxID=1328759 RepID=A0A5C2SCN2_9APHY|nr:hypothetical protein L227DRAFT_610511 [Lentinus tigrinus ALCF2SS1-6]